ncbi:hypothetical protein GCM10009564_53380 [Streptomyces thermogriseus]|uniref:Uncharacterized protein n=1 Tax=Streptomyces thermogriseus TaxID=75292 RepID=A0ABP4DQE3_9ACTN
MLHNLSGRCGTAADQMAGWLRAAATVPGWFWAAGSDDTRTAAGSAGRYREVIMPYPPDIRRHVLAESAGGAQ